MGYYEVKVSLSTPKRDYTCEEKPIFNLFAERGLVGKEQFTI